MNPASFGWGRVARLGLVQACLGAIVVITTSTLNRVMVVELALPALLPGLLVAWHYLVQVVRPRMGHGADTGGRCTPWILGGMGVLAVGGVLAAAATAWMATARGAGIALAVLAFSMIGVGVSACGTSLLTLLSKRVDPARSAGAATLVWLMMIAGFAVTAGVSGRFLDPYTPERLVMVTATVAGLACLVALVAIWGLEGQGGAAATAAASSTSAMKAAGATSATARPAVVHSAEPKPAFRQALASTWADPVARRFTVFVFLSMLAYSAQDLILEPFAGAVLGFTPGESTRLSGVQHGGALAGMLLAAFAGRRLAGRSAGSLRGWTVGGCLLSAVALWLLAAIGALGGAGGVAVFKATVFLLGAANGAFSIAAIASMMRLAGEGGGSRAGVRMGLWGAAQAVAFGLGGLVGTGASDLARWWLGTPGPAYGLVFALEGGLFVFSALLAARAIPASQPAAPPAPQSSADDGLHPASARLATGSAR